MQVYASSQKKKYCISPQPKKKFFISWRIRNTKQSSLNKRETAQQNGKYLKTEMLVGCVGSKCVFMIRSMASRLFVNCTFEQQTDNQFLARSLFRNSSPRNSFLSMILPLLLYRDRKNVSCYGNSQNARTSKAMHYTIESKRRLKNSDKIM